MGSTDKNVVADTATSRTATGARTGGRARRLRIGAAALAVPGLLLAATAGGIATAEQASASAVITVPSRGVASFPTWFWGKTTFCVQSVNGSSGIVRVNLPTGAGEDVAVLQGRRSCISRNWWGAPIFTQNFTNGYVTEWTY